MDFIYVLTMIILGIAFMLYKKSEEKLSFVKWLVILILLSISYNISVAMFFGLLAIRLNLLVFSLINIALSFVLGFKAIKNKDFQKYYFSKLEIFGLIVIILIFGVMLFKDMKIQNGDIVHIAIDSSIHYRAAKHYSDTMMAFINVEDKTFFDFNIMQTGAYINDGLLMHVLHNISGGKITYPHVYEFFECLMVFMCGLGLYGIFVDKIKGKLGFILSMAFYALYIYGYPYNSYLYGFSYLTVGLVNTLAVLGIVDLLYSKEKINKTFAIVLLAINSFGLIFSYCLFAPIVYAAVCIYCFIKDFGVEEKAFLKIFKTTTITVTIVLFLIAVVGVCYFIIPAHFINGQEPVSDAIKNDGAVYTELWRNEVYYVPFALLYAYTFVKGIIKKDRKLEFLDVFSVLYVGFYGIMYIAMRKAIISPYYFHKTYFVLWIIMFAITIKLINQYLEIPKLKKFIITYSAAWPIFVLIMLILTTSRLLPEEKKHAIPNFIGMYYTENCDARGAFLINLNFKNAQQEIAQFVRENLEDATADNTVMITRTYNERCWATVTTELSTPNKNYRAVIQDGMMHHFSELENNPEMKYVVSFQGSKDYDAWQNKNVAEILFKNDSGYVAKRVEK